MNRHMLIAGAFALGTIATACSSNPPRELRDARTAHQQATQKPTAGLVPAQMRDSQQALSRAEKEFDSEGDEPSSRDLAYIAHRKAIAASAAADTAAALEQKKGALAELEQAKQQMAATTKGQLDQTKMQLSASEQKLASERSARAAADQRAQDALSKIEGLKTERSDKGLVLTLSGSVLFASGKATLLPAAQKRLGEVGAAIKDDGRSLLIVGHTDAQGDDAKNMELSKRRADAVKTFLATHGIPADRIRTDGAGESQPVADNTSAEGRANNRRVELILEDQNQNQSGGTNTAPKDQPNPQTPTP